MSATSVQAGLRMLRSTPGLFWALSLCSGATLDPLPLFFGVQAIFVASVPALVGLTEPLSLLVLMGFSPPLFGVMTFATKFPTDMEEVKDPFLTLEDGVNEKDPLLASEDGVKDRVKD